MVRYAFSLSLACLLGGCNSTGVGNPGATAELSIISDNKPEPDAEDTEPPLPEQNLTQAIIVVEKFEWTACNSDEESVTLHGPFIIDLVKKSVTPKLPVFEVPENGFCGLDAQLGEAKAPAAVAYRSMLFAGRRTDESRFILYASIKGTIRIRPKPGRAWTANTNGAWLFAFRPQRWLSLRELDAVELATDSTDAERIIAIDANRHPLLLSAIRARLGRRSTLHQDLDRNGIIDDSERTGTSWLGTGLSELD